MKRGEIYEYRAPGSAMARVVVLSVDAHNDDPHAWPIVAMLARRPTVAHPYVPALADPDPYGGAVHVATVGAVDRRALSGPHGMLTGATMDRIEQALRALFNL